MQMQIFQQTIMQSFWHVQLHTRNTSCILYNGVHKRHIILRKIFPKISITWRNENHQHWIGNMSYVHNANYFSTCSYKYLLYFFTSFTYTCINTFRLICNLLKQPFPIISTNIKKNLIHKKYISSLMEIIYIVSTMCSNPSCPKVF